MTLKVKNRILKTYPFADNSKISWEQFIQLASETSRLYRFPAKITICQAALESGRGTSLMAKTKNNYFGFMAYDSDPEKARGYVTALDSIIDYLELITKNARYSQAMKYKTPLRIMKAIHQSGYATDAKYVAKIVSLKEWGE